MKTDDILTIDGITPLSPVISSEICGVYCGELPGVALGKLKANQVWLTACANINTLAVAYQKNAACIIICDNTSTDEEFEKTAAEHKITVFQTDLPVYETAAEIYRLMNFK